MMLIKAFSGQLTHSRKVTSLIRFLSFLSLLSFVQQVTIIITIFITISKCHDANESLIWTNDPHLVYRRFWIWDAGTLDWVQVAYNMNFTAIVRSIDLSCNKIVCLYNIGSFIIIITISEYHDANERLIWTNDPHLLGRLRTGVGMGWAILH